MNANTSLRFFARLLVRGVAAVACVGTTAFAQEGPQYNCPPGYLWTSGGCVQAPSRPPQGQKPKPLTTPKAHSLAPFNSQVTRTDPNLSSLPKSSHTVLPSDSRPSEIPPKMTRSSIPRSEGRGALNPQPIPPGYPPKPLSKSVPGKSQ